MTSWTEAHAYASEPDDPLDPPPVRILTEKCPVCGMMYKTPADNAEWYCSSTCDLKADEQRRKDLAEIEAMMATHNPTKIMENGDECETGATG